MSKTEVGHRRRSTLPAAITALRAVAAPLLFLYFRHPEPGGLGLFFLVALSDLLDGYLARRSGIASSWGAYADVTADFLCVIASFAAFVVADLYPFWLLLVIGAMFVQFLLTSRQRRLVYDPVGKYYGAFLFAGIGITLAFPVVAVCRGVLFSLTLLTGISLSCRILTYLKRS